MSVSLLAQQPVNANENTPAAKIALRLDLEPCPPGRGVYCPLGWEVEDMGIGRAMGDSVLLPNGRVTVLNGAQVSSMDRPQRCM